MKPFTFLCAGRWTLLWWGPLVLAGLVWLPLGCATLKTNAPTSSSRIDELNLVAMPVALSLDAVPGPEGFVVKVYATDQSNPKPKPIKSGNLEVLMFDGIFDPAKLAANQYRHLWTFSATQLKPYEFTTTIGTGYNLALVWGEDKPREDRISVLVRYRPPDGPLIYSAPSAVTVSTK